MRAGAMWAHDRIAEQVGHTQENHMTTTTFVSRGRVWLPTLSLVFAIAALVIALSAFVIARRDDVDTVTQQPSVELVPAGSPAGAGRPSPDVIDQTADGAVTPVHFYGCDGQLIGTNRC